MNAKPNPIKAQVQSSVSERLEQYKGQRSVLAEHLSRNPTMPLAQRGQDAQSISKAVEELRSIFERILPFARDASKHVPDVLEHSRFSASYLLIGKAIRTWQAILALANGGFHHEIMELLRSNREAMDLASHFILGEESSPDLSKWFSGRIISNEEARKSMHGYVNEELKATAAAGIFKEIKSGVYSMFSLYSHVSYAALIDSYDIFEDDFDFSGTSGLHYTNASSLPFARGELLALLDILRMFYLKVEDLDSFESLTKILVEVSPEMYDRERFEKLADEVVRKYSPDTTS